MYGSDVRLKDTILLSNTSTYLDGGGVYASGSLVVYDSLFQGNRATQTGADGGAIYSKASSTTMISNTRFIENSATGAGGAIATEVPGAPRYGLSLVNSLLARRSGSGRFRPCCITPSSAIRRISSQPSTLAIALRHRT